MPAPPIPQKALKHAPYMPHPFTQNCGEEATICRKPRLVLASCDVCSKPFKNANGMHNAARDESGDGFNNPQNTGLRQLVDSAQISDLRLLVNAFAHKSGPLFDGR